MLRRIDIYRGTYSMACSAEQSDEWDGMIHTTSVCGLQDETQYSIPGISVWGL